MMRFGERREEACPKCDGSFIKTNPRHAQCGTCYGYSKYLKDCAQRERRPLSRSEWMKLKESRRHIRNIFHTTQP